MNHDHAAEQSVLGAMLLSAAAIDDATAVVSGADFHRPHHERIFDAIVEIRDAGQKPDPILVGNHLGATADLDRCGGLVYLYDLIQNVPTPGMAAHYAHIVRGHAQVRALDALATRIKSRANNPGTDLDDVPALLLSAIRDIETTLAGVGHTGAAVRAADMLDTVLDAIENPANTPLIATGLHDLDDAYPGHGPGQLIVIGARPSVGKSVVGLTMARNAAANGIHTLFISLEMSTVEIIQRLIAAEASVPLDHITKSACTDYDWDRIAAATSRVAEVPLFIDDTPSVGLPQIRTALDRMRRGDGVGLLIVDYLQLMTAPKAENRQQQVAELSRGLKLLAKEFAIPVVALAQLNRDSEKRQDKTPVMSDLRESGALENDADSILLLHRPELYGDESRFGECDVIVAKCRAGRICTVPVAFQGHYARVASFAREPWTPHAALRSVA